MSRERNAANIGGYEHRLCDVVFYTQAESEKIEAEQKQIAAVDFDCAMVREWYHESKCVIVKNDAALAIKDTLPWSEILVFAPDGKQSPYQMTHNTWLMTGIVEGFDRLSYEAFRGNMVVTVWKDRLQVCVYGSRKKRKRLKQECMRLIAGQVSGYYNVKAAMRFSRAKNAYILHLRNVVPNDNHS